MRYTFSLLAGLLLLLSGCYRMPTDDDCCLIPTTNNPNVYKDAGGASGNMMPGAGF